jgi:Dyp-type peroxidase family
LLNLDNLQGGVVRGYANVHWRIDLAKWANPQQCRTWLTDRLTSVTSAAHKPSGPTLNIAFTAPGLSLLGVQPETLRSVSPAFIDGMASRALALGDHGSSAPSQWTFARSDQVVHAIVIRSSGTIHDEHQFDGDGTLDPLAADWPSISGKRRRDAREPFGFRDGSSNPVTAGSGQPMRAGNGVATEYGWRPLAAGEVVLGQHDETGALAGHPGSAHLEADGTYVVIRQLRQHVARFHEVTSQLAAATHRSVDEVQAMMVGRWPDANGTPFGVEVPAGDPGFNDFRFNTPNQMPATAHIHRANPRDGIEFADRVVPRHMMLRRGFPYGEAGGNDEGLVFVAYCADLARQFEFVQGQWLEDGNRFGLGRERDPLTGNREAPDSSGPSGTPGTVPHAQSTSIRFPQGAICAMHQAEPFVTTLGGLYGFVPSMSVLAQLADGDVL